MVTDKVYHNRHMHFTESSFPFVYLFDIPSSTCVDSPTIMSQVHVPSWLVGCNSRHHMSVSSNQFTVLGVSVVVSLQLDFVLHNSSPSMLSSTTSIMPLKLDSMLHNSSPGMLSSATPIMPQSPILSQSPTIHDPPSVSHSVSLVVLVHIP